MLLLLALPAIIIIINMSISYICQTFLHYFPTCFPITTNPNSPKQTHTQLPFRKSLHEQLAHFLWAWPQTQRVQLGVQSNCNQCWIAFPPFSPSQKPQDFFSWFLGSNAKGCAINGTAKERLTKGVSRSPNVTFAFVFCLVLGSRRQGEKEKL